MRTAFCLLTRAELDAARVPVLDVMDPSFDAAKLEPVLARAPRLAMRDVMPEHVEALARALRVGAQPTTWSMEDGAIVELPEALCVALAAVTPEAEQDVGRRWARRARADGLENVLPPLARFARGRREEQLVYLVVLV